MQDGTVRRLGWSLGWTVGTGPLRHNTEGRTKPRGRRDSWCEQRFPARPPPCPWPECQLPCQVEGRVLARPRVRGETLAAGQRVPTHLSASLTVHPHAEHPERSRGTTVLPPPADFPRTAQPLWSPSEPRSPHLCRGDKNHGSKRRKDEGPSSQQRPWECVLVVLI